MIPDLFSIAVPAAISGAINWSTWRLLDAVVGCPSCGVDHERTVTNHVSNHLDCGCSKSLEQHVAASQPTLVNGRLMSAQIFNPHWQTKKGFFGGVQGHWFILDVATSGMANNGIVVEGKLEEFRGSWKRKMGPAVLNNNSNRCNHPRISWWFDTAFPRGDIVASMSVKTLDGDVLHDISPPYKFK